MIESLARDMGPEVDEEQAIQFVLDDLEERGLHLRLPDSPPRIKATFLVMLLLSSGVAKETPEA